MNTFSGIYRFCMGVIRAVSRLCVGFPLAAFWAVSSPCVGFHFLAFVPRLETAQFGRRSVMEPRPLWLCPIFR